MECSGCKKHNVNKDELGDKCFHCDLCKAGLCEKCAAKVFSATELRVLQLKKDRRLMYTCGLCWQKVQTGRTQEEHIREVLEEQLQKYDGMYETFFKKKLAEDRASVKMLEEENRRIKETLEEIKNLSSLGNQKLENEIRELKEKMMNVRDGTNKRIPEVKSYNQALKQETIVVKPKDEKQSSSVTKQEVEKRVNPMDLGLGIARIKYVNKGGVALNCAREGMNFDAVCTDLESKLGQQYEVKKLEKKNPKIKIFNVYKKDAEDADELAEKIIKQNSLTGDAYVKVDYKYSARDDKFVNVIVDIDAETLLQLRNKDKEVINIGWKMCKFIDYLHVVQCYKCNRWGHVSKYCRSETEICSRCTGEHISKDCESSVLKCSNCKHATEVLKVPNIDSNHSALDKSCAVYKRIIQQVEQKINYPEGYTVNVRA